MAQTSPASCRSSTSTSTSSVGQVSFSKPVDLTTVGSLSAIGGGVVLLDDHVCAVYPDESNKPPRGQGLNVAAVISLHGCWPTDRAYGRSFSLAEPSPPSGKRLRPYARSLAYGRSGMRADAGLMMARGFRVAFGLARPTTLRMRLPTISAVAQPLPEWHTGGGGGNCDGGSSTIGGGWDLGFQLLSVLHRHLTTTTVVVTPCKMRLATHFETLVGFCAECEALWFIKSEARNMRVKSSVTISDMVSVVTRVIHGIEGVIGGDLGSKAAASLLLPLAQDMHIVTLRVELFGRSDSECHLRGTYPGGSSSGSACATALGLAAAAIGTEADGSIISPSMCQSVVGFKPSRGLCSNPGIIPTSTTLDTPGPICRSEDVAAMLEAISRGDTNFTDLDAFGIKGARIGITLNNGSELNEKNGAHSTDRF
ncbi:hypothetical protein EV179_006423 [Coemansia sp. RSA 487]|nr:hypothetical protein EV179_006423 [Coemansia sp. RSA 487]